MGRLGRQLLGLGDDPLLDVLGLGAGVVAGRADAAIVTDVLLLLAPGADPDADRTDAVSEALGEPAAAPIETRGSPRVLVRPATVRAASLPLKRSTARSRRLLGDSLGSGSGRRPTLAPGAAGSTQPSFSARPRQSSQTRWGPSFGLM